MRVGIDVVVLLCVLNAWWYAALVIAVIGAWYFQYYAELIVAGVAYDALFGMIDGYGIYGYAGTLISFLASVAVSLAKKIVRH